MVAMFKLIRGAFLLTLLLGFVISSAFAEKESLGRESLSSLESQMIDFSDQKMRKTINQLHQKIDICFEKIKNTKLDLTVINVLESMSLTPEELRTVLLYFNFYAQNKCEGLDTWAKASQDFAQFKYLEKKFTGKNTETIINNHIYTLNQLCCHNEIYIEMELKYLNLPLSTRIELEKIIELQNPFNVSQAVETLEALSEAKLNANKE